MKTFPILFLLALLGPSCNAHQDAAVVHVTPDTSFTGRGNKNETLLSLSIKPSGECQVKSVSVTLTAEAGDVVNLNAALNGKIISSVPVKEGKDIYVLKCKAFIDSMSLLTIGVDIAEDAEEGGLVSAEVNSIGLRGGALTPEPHESGSREILLVRKCLYRPGDYGSNHWRIPAVRQLQDGTLLTVNDRRNLTEQDLPGEIDVVSRFSIDGGRTWSEPVFIAKNKGKMFGYGDPSLVELSDGTLICCFCGGQRLDKSSREDPQRSYYAVSKDYGRTWSEPVDITRFIWGPNPSNPFCKRYKSSFFSSGNSLVLTQGKHKGRILAANVTTYNGWKGLCNHAVYSDDAGRTWNVSGLAYPDKGDEAKMVQLLDGRVLMSIRQKGNRAFVVSEDDGETWGEPGFWPDLCVTACNGDLIRYNDKILMHTVPNSMKRENVSVFLSYDEGGTWPEHKTICAGPSQYSSITVLQDGTIGAYIEENSNKAGTELWFESFSLDWLQNNKAK